MKTVRIHFIGDISIEVPYKLWQLVQERLDIIGANNWQGFQDEYGKWMCDINLNNVIFVELIDPLPSTSDVVTPPSPAELREEKQREEDSKDVSLDAQLKAVE